MKSGKTRSLLFALLCGVSLAAHAASPGGDQIEALQKVIDQQQQEIQAQREQLDAQKQRLDEQDSRLEALQEQLEKLVSGQQETVPTADETVADKPAVTGVVGPAAPAAAAPPTEQPQETGKGFIAGPDALADAAAAMGILKRPVGPLSINDPHLILDHHPLDVADDRGIFIHSRDKQNIFRIYGSIRTLAVYDNRQNFHAYDLDIPKVPFGPSDVKDWNTDWTIKTSKLGFQMGIRDYFGVRAEFDWKGEGDDDLRIRHLYGRTAHWLIGQHWSAFNTLNFLPLAIDSHATSAHLGGRPVQVKYLGGEGHWSWQASAEYFQPKFNEPDLDIFEPEFVDARARNTLPNLVGNLTYRRPWGLARVGAAFTRNRIRYDFEDGDSSTSTDTGFALMAGVMARISEKDTIRAHIQRTHGNLQLGADYSLQRYDMAYNPDIDEYVNLKGWGAQVAFEHKWTPTLSSAIGGGWMEQDNRSYQPGWAFSQGYKGLVNLFYRPAGWLKGMTVAGELEFAGQKTLDGSRGDTTRISVLVLYDF